jgi:hypothetical protein
VVGRVLRIKGFVEGVSRDKRVVKFVMGAPVMMGGVFKKILTVQISRVLFLDTKILSFFVLNKKKMAADLWPFSVECERKVQTVQEACCRGRAAFTRED